MRRMARRCSWRCSPAGMVHPRPRSWSSRRGPGRSWRPPDMGAGSAALERAFAHDTAGQETEAIPEYRAAIEAGLEDDELLGALLGLGSSLRNVGELEESARVLRQGVTRFPDHAALRVYLALT